MASAARVDDTHQLSLVLVEPLVVQWLIRSALRGVATDLAVFGHPPRLDVLVGHAVFTRKWWHLPVVVVLLMLGVLVLIGGSAMAPRIYTLF